MRFEIKPPIIFYIDETPYKNVSLKVAGRSCAFDSSASSFNDAARSYRWAFIGMAGAGEEIVFTADGHRCSMTYDQAVESTPAVAVEKMTQQLAGGIRLLVGAGPDAPTWSKQGWLCNDLEDAAKLYEGISIVGPCWALPIPDNTADEIMARGMIEHLTYHEVGRAFAEWIRILKPGGFFTGEVPDVDEYIREYLKMRAGQERGERFPEGTDGGAEGEPADREVCTGIDRWLRRALWGWQRWPGDEHRSGWTEQLFRYYLQKSGASRVEIRRMSESFDKDDPTARVHHLWARAWK